MIIYIFSHARTHTNTNTGSSGSKESSFIARDIGSIPGSRRSPGKGNGYPLQYSCLENSMDREAWEAYSSWGQKSWTWLSKTSTFSHRFALMPGHTHSTHSLTPQVSSVAQVSLRFGRERAEWWHCDRRKDRCNLKKSFNNLELWMVHSNLFRNLRKDWSMLMIYISSF